MPMEQTKFNIQALEKQDRREKTLVIVLLVFAIVLAIWAFTRPDSSPMRKDQDVEDISLPDQGEAMDSKKEMDQRQGDINSTETNENIDSIVQSVSSSEDTGVNSLNEEGILAVGLFQNPENAERMKEKLNELGFKGIMIKRADNKIIVGVESKVDDHAFHAKIIAHFNDAVFVKRPD